MKQFITYITFGYLGMFLMATAVFAQNRQEVNNIPDISYLRTSSGNLDSLLEITACGLNYTQGSVLLGKRMFPVIGKFQGIDQPAPIQITNIPPTANIEKAFLYWSISGPGTGNIVNFENTQGVSKLVTAETIGVGPDKAWGYAGTYTFRADVTTLITGNGNYYISELPVDTVPGNTEDTDGASLLIIYSDPTADFAGTIHIHDGSVVLIANSYSNAITNVYPSDTAMAKAFLIVSDMQNMGTKLKMNNGPFVSVLENFWDFQEKTTVVIPGQKLSSYGVQSPSDAVNLIAAGLYYQIPLNFGDPVISQENDTLFCSVQNASYQWYFNNQAIPGATQYFHLPTLFGNYSVHVSNEYGCERQSASYFLANAIHKVHEQTFSIHPNPGRGEFSIETTKTAERKHLVIRDIAGKVLYEQNFEDSATKVDLNHFSPGMYVISISSDNYYKTAKLIIR